MRKIFLALLLIGICVMNANAQDATGKETKAEDTLRPYQKYPTLPAFNILGLDSVTIFNTYNIPTGNITGIIFFDPNCKHCQHTIKKLLAGMDSVSNIRFYMVTPIHSLQEIRNFCTEYHLADYKNIVLVGRDYEFFFIEYYKIKSFPDIVLYDGHKKLIKLIEGEFTASELYKYTH